MKLDLNNDRDTCVAEGLATLVGFWPFLIPRSCGKRSSCGGVLHNTGAPRGKTAVHCDVLELDVSIFISLQKWA